MSEALTRIRPRATAISVAVALAAGTALAGTWAGAAIAAPPGPATDDPAAVNLPGQPAAARPAATHKAKTETVTLVTGDKVRLETMPDGGQQATPAEGGDTAGGTSFQFTWRGDQYVIPAEAAPYLGGTLDLRLFNVSYLARAGLGDKDSASLPVRVEASRAKTEGLPATSATSATDGVTKAKVAKDDAKGLGELLAQRWRDARNAPARLGTLDGIDEIALAPPADAPKAPAAPEENLLVGAAGTTKTAAGTRFHTVTVDPIGRDGEPGVFMGWLHSVQDTAAANFLSEFPGAERRAFSVPEGTYSIEASVFTGPADDLSSVAALVVEPEFTVTGDMTVTLDARKAVPFTSEVEGASGLTRMDVLTFGRTPVRGAPVKIDPNNIVGAFLLIGMKLVSHPDIGNQPLYATPTRPVTKGGFDLLGMSSLTEGTAAVIGAGATYKLAFPYQGAIPGTLAHTIARADLTTLKRTIHTGASDQGPTGPVNLADTVYVGWTSTNLGLGNRPAAGDRTDYWYTPAPDRVVWQSGVGADSGSRIWGPRLRIRPGQVITDAYNRGPLVPAPAPYLVEYVVAYPGSLNQDTTAATPMARLCAACRQDDMGVAYLTPFGEPGRGHYVTPEPFNDDSRFDFYRDGRLAFTTDATLDGKIAAQPLTLPMQADAATYRLVWRAATPKAPGRSSSTDWTFRSARNDARAALSGDAMCAADTSRGCSFLPLLFVGYDLPLSDDSRAPAGEEFDVRFTVGHQPDQPAPTGVEATVEASFDGGETWSEPATATAGADGVLSAPITHPAYSEAGRWVSLRIKAHDADGNAVTQTTIRAYRLAG